ncbi:DNA-binding response regulator [Marinilabiliaceae bacterium JC017]|nr:DNA-binding response regulator [Marinilabiliaceae bacterium JC017]
METITCYLLDDAILDNDNLEKLLKMQTGFEVVGRKSCPECGVKEIRQLKPHIVFLDIIMPKMTGFDVVRQLRDDGCMTTIIFVSTDSQYAIKALRNEAFDYLVKPIDVVELRCALNRYMQRKDTIHIPCNWHLSGREKQVLKLVAQGKTSKQIADILFLSKYTVDLHRKHILEKCGCCSSSELIGILKSYPGRNGQGGRLYS